MIFSIEYYLNYGLIKKYLPIYSICAAIQTGIVYRSRITACGTDGCWAK